MRPSPDRGVLIAGLLCALSAPGALADIYKVVEENGAVTFTNTPPEDRSVIVHVYPSSDWPPPPSPAEQQSAELRALAERVDRLNQLLEDERRASTAPSYAPPQYVAAAPPEWDGGYGWNGWGGWNGWFGSPFFGPGVVVVGAPFKHGFQGFNKFHRFNKFGHVNQFRGFNKFGHGHRFQRFGPGVIQGRPNIGVRVGGGAHFRGSRAGFRRR